MSDRLLISEQPELHDALMLTAWSGWSDAAESATRALKYLVHELDAVKFAEIDAEEFYIFTEQRPIVRNSMDGSRLLRWPRNEFFWWKSDSALAPDLVILVGDEPNLKWRNYTSLVADLGVAVGVSMLATVGALLDSVPHTRSPRVFSTSIHDDLGERYSHVSYPKPNYEGPSGMTSATIDAFAKRGINAVSIWGHAPHYLQVPHNPAITLGIVREICRFASISVDTYSLERDATDFTDRVGYALRDQSEVTEYVRTLEERYDSEVVASQDPEPGEVIDELDAFLRSRNLDDDDDGDKNDDDDGGMAPSRG